MHSNDAYAMTNSLDPDQNAPSGAVWSGSTLFTKTCLYENLGSLLYLLFIPAPPYSVPFLYQ